MTNITLTIPEEMYEIMLMHKEVRWSEVARKAILQYIGKLKMMDELLSESELSLGDVLKTDKKVKKALGKRYL